MNSTVSLSEAATLCRIMRILLALLLFSLSSPAAEATRIVWDTYGVPHVFARNRAEMFYAHGWAQMHNQADLLLLLYGQSRGRAAEYWGPQYLALDRWLALNGMPARAEVWYNAQIPQFRHYLDAFAAGINDYAKEHSETIAPAYRCVLPVSGIDVVGHALRVVHYMYMGSEERLRHELDLHQPETQVARNAISSDAMPGPGSNTWALGPSRSSSGRPLLLINPHLQWGETFFRYMEVHLTAPDYDLYGAPQIGFPVPVVGFNRQAGWGRTVNTIDTVDFYKLEKSGDGYLFDGKRRSFETSTHLLKIKTSNGAFREERLLVRNAVQGPVVYDSGGLTLSMRVAGLDRPKMLEQWFRMGEAHNLTEFTQALRMMSVPMWNANYAGSDGHIMLVFDGLVPRRSYGVWQDWASLVPGSTSKSLWHDYLSFDELPKVVDPPSGFTQNTNEPPWTMTLPPLDPTYYPSHLSPPLSAAPTFRTLRSLRLLSMPEKISYDDFLAAKHSTRMELADAILPDLLAQASKSGEREIRAAATVLSAWDRSANADSRGAVLFQLFVDSYFGTGNIDGKLRVRWDPSRPLDSSKGLSDLVAATTALAHAASICRERYGSLDVPWGDVNRFASGEADVPANGASGRLGVIRTFQFSKEKGKRFYAAHGETFVCAIEFGTPQMAQCALSYGNASQHGSPHLEDQLALIQARKLHPVWRERSELEGHIEAVESLAPALK